MVYGSNRVPEGLPLESLYSSRFDSAKGKGGFHASMNYEIEWERIDNEYSSSCVYGYGPQYRKTLSRMANSAMFLMNRASRLKG